MDSNSVLILGAALVAGLAVGVAPLSAILRAGSALRSALASESGGGTESDRVPPDPDDLDPYRLALLCGGPVRVGETAVMDAFLHGRIRRQAAGDFFTLVGPSHHHLDEKDPVRRDLVRAFRGRAGVSAREMVRRVANGRGVRRHRADLVEARLIVDSPRLRESLRAREKAAKTIRRTRVLGLLVGLAGVGAFFLAGTDTMPLALLVAGLAAVTALTAAQAVVSVSGGPVLRPTTSTGSRVVELARERYGSAALPRANGVLPHGGMTRDQAIRRTAATGFRELSRPVSTGYGGPLYDGGAGAGAGAASVGRGDSAAATAETEPVTLESLGAFAELCQGSSGGGRGGSSGDDGWGGGLVSSDVESGGGGGGLGGGLGGGWGGDGGGSDGGGGGGGGD